MPLHVVETGQVGVDGLELLCEAGKVDDRSHEEIEDRLEGEQSAEREFAPHHERGAERQHDRLRQERLEVGRHRLDREPPVLEFLPASASPGLRPHHARQEVTLASRGLERFHGLQADRHDPCLPTGLLLGDAGLVAQRAGRPGDDERDHGCDEHRQQREPQVDRDHGHQVEQPRRRTGDGGKELRPQQLAQPFDAAQTRDHLAGQAMRVEVHREPQRMLHEPRAAGHAHAALEPDQDRRLDRREHRLGQHRHEREADDRHDPARLPARQHAVDEDRPQHGHGDPRDRHEHAGDECHDDRRTGATQARAQRRPGRRRLARRLEALARLDLDAHTREVTAELVGRHLAAPQRGIHQVPRGAVETLKDEEVVEAPVQDRRHGHAGEFVELGAQPVCIEAMVAGRLGDLERVAPIAAHAARTTEFLQRAMATVMGQDRRERGGTALGGLHLQDHGHVHRRDALERARGIRGGGTGAHSAGSAPGLRVVGEERGQEQLHR